MCGRFIVSYTYDELVNFMSNTFDIFDLDSDIQVPRYNVAPGQQVISVISDGEKFRTGTFKWGFIPGFAKDKNIGYKMINARVEGIKDKVAFKDSFVNKRCVILADGYYEWQKDGQKKIPYLIQKNRKQMFMFAGLWSKFENDTETLYTTTIITTQANELLSDVHHRMPIILSEENAKMWLDRTIKDEKRLISILDNNDNADLFKIEVSDFVNSVKNESPKCIEEVIPNRLF